jgi:DNA transformation protein
MAVSAAYLAYIVDQLASFSKVRSRRMFGAVGLYAGDTFFAVIADDTLYFKVDDANRGDYLARHCTQFQPYPNEPDKYSMSYFTVPPEVIEDADELQSWARKAQAAAASVQLSKAARSQKARAKAPRKGAVKKRPARS